MGQKLYRVWSGPIKDLPEQYIKNDMPEDYVNVTIYSDGSRIYDKGLVLTESLQDKINYRLSRCWDSLNEEVQMAINSHVDLEEDQ